MRLCIWGPVAVHVVLCRGDGNGVWVLCARTPSDPRFSEFVHVADACQTPIISLRVSLFSKAGLLTRNTDSRGASVGRVKLA